MNCKVVSPGIDQPIIRQPKWGVGEPGEGENGAHYYIMVKLPDRGGSISAIF